MILGSCDDPQYIAELNALSKGNVTIRGEYISDKDAQQLIVQSEGVIICHAEDDVIVSGTFFYALSLGVTVFALETDFIRWVNSELGDDVVLARRTISELTQSLPTAPRTRMTGVTDPRVQHLFGNETVQHALSDLLTEIGVR
jgi:CubicO group peptidase (beta-lactamase class C family)